MAEAFVNLAEHTHRDVSKVEVVPVKLRLKRASCLAPAAKDGFKMGEYLLSHQMLGKLVETQILRFTCGAICSGDGFVDKGEKITIERVVEPRRGLSGLLSRGERIFEVIGCSADAVAPLQFIFEDDAAIYEEAEEKRAPCH